MQALYEALLRDLNAKIWDYSEPKFKEWKSSAVMTELLEQEGFSLKKGLGGIPTAFSASYGEGYPCVGILGEYDALSGLSQVADIPFMQEREGIEFGHGCGHCQLGTAALGATLKIRDFLRDRECAGRVIFFGCPAEEGGSGKAYMAREGVFDKLDMALTWHPDNCNIVVTGSFQANCQAYFRFNGVSAHAASAPHLGRSALDAVELMDVGANYLREHIEPTDCLHYAILDTGGNAPNVIPSRAEVVYLMRSVDSEKVAELYQRVCKIAQGAALMTETEVEIIFDKACSNVLSNSVLEQLLYDKMVAVGVPEYTNEDVTYAEKFSKTISQTELESEEAIQLLPLREKKRILGMLHSMPIADFIIEHRHLDIPVRSSSDVGDVSHVVPTAQFLAACAVPGTPAHSWQRVAQGKSEIAVKGLLFAADVLAAAAIEAYTNHTIVERAKAEFLETTGGNPYCCPIPNDIFPNQNFQK